MQYRLTCGKCGHDYPVETRQAGGTLVCECGETIQIPTMLKMKRLPEWEESAPEAETPASAEKVEQQVETNADAAQTVAEPKKQSALSRITGLSGKRWGLFIVAALVLIFCATKIGMNARTPDPRAIFYKQIDYMQDGKAIRRDSSPITVGDYGFYFLQDPEHPYVVTDELIDAFSDFYAYQYFDYVKELDMSDNFYDNYEALITKWRLYLMLYSIVAGIALIVALYALFAKESHKQVGVRRGEGWV